MDRLPYKNVCKKYCEPIKSDIISRIERKMVEVLKFTKIKDICRIVLLFEDSRYELFIDMLRTILILIIFLLVNNLYKKTNYYNNQILEISKYHKENRNNLKIVNLGEYLCTVCIWKF